VTEDMNSEQGRDRTRKLILELKKKVPVETTVGTLFARRHTINDLEPFGEYLNSKADKAGTDLRALGELSLRTLVNESSESEQKAPLPEHLFARLSGEDIGALAAGVVKASRLTLSQSGDALEALGSAMFDYVIENGRRLAESGKRIREEIDRQFGGISDTVRKSLETSLGGLSSLRDTLRRSDGFEAFRKMAEDDKAWRKQLTDSLGGTGFEALRKVAEDDKAIREQLQSGLGFDSAFDELCRDMREQEGLKRATPKDFIPQVDRATPFLLPRVEETPLGRSAQASEESARQMKEVAGITAQLADKVAEVSQVVMTKVLPEWYRSLSDSAEASKTSLKHAERSLFWAKWALVGSIVATIVMTGLQLWVGRDYKLANDAQQDRMEKLLASQVEESRRLTSHLAEESRQLREALEKLRPAPALDATVAPTRSAPRR
jgi:hypothetical protein